MTTFAAPRLRIPDLGEAVEPRPYSPDEPPEAERVRAARAAHVDGLVAKNRLIRNAGGAGAGPELRKTPRLSVTELNGLDAAAVRRKFAESGTDDRGPLATVIDWLDLPRNTNANILWGKPTAGGVLGSLGEGAAFGAGMGLAGGPAGAGVGAAVGAGIVGATQLASLIGRQFTSDEGRNAITSQGEGHGAFNQPHVYTSQALDRMGVKSDVARAILGLAGDIAIDPLVYMGPAGFTAKMTGKVAGGAERFVALTKSGNKALNAGVAAAAAGREASDTAVNAYLMAKGFSPEAVRGMLSAGKTEAQVQREIQTAIRGGVTNSWLGRKFSVVGHEIEEEGGSLVRDFHAATDDAASVAAKKLIESHGVGLSERGLRFVPKGQAGRAWAHVPFTDVSLTLPELARANGIGRQQAFVISSLKNGIMRDAPVVPGAAVAADAALKIDRMMTEAKAAAEANAEDLAHHEALIRNLRENPPEPPPASPGIPSDLPPGPDAPSSGAVEAPHAQPELHPLQEQGQQPAPGLASESQLGHGESLPTRWYRGVREGQDTSNGTFYSASEDAAGSFGAVGKPVEITPKNPMVFDDKQAAADALGLGVEDVLGSDLATHAKVDKAIADHARAQGHDAVVYRNGSFDAPELHLLAEPPKAPAPKSRQQLIDEMHAAFSDVPEDARAAAVALADARARAMGMTHEDFWREHFAGFQRGLPAAGETLPQNGLGAVNFLEDGRALVSALEKPNASTIPHELGHVFRRTLDDDARAVVEAHYGIGESKWERAHEERYARDFEKYLATGKAPTEKLRSVFEQFKGWLADIYRRIVGTPLEKKLSKEMRAHFDRLLGSEVDARPLGGKAVQKLGSRSEVLRRLERSTEEHRSMMHWENESDRLIAAGADAPGQEYGFDASFHGELPAEAKEALQGKFHLMRHVRTNQHGGMAADFIGQHGADKWVQLLEEMHGSREAKIIRAARTLAEQGDTADPAVGFYVHLLDNWPRTREMTGGKYEVSPKTLKRFRTGHTFKSNAIPKAAVDLDTLPADSAFTINGVPMFVTRDDYGAHIHYAPNKSVPGSMVGHIGIDAGSVKQLDESEASQVAEHFMPGGPEVPNFAPEIDEVGDGPLFQKDDVAGQNGLFGTGVVRTGEQQGGLFGSMKPETAPEAPNPLARREGESLEDWKIRAKFQQAEANTGSLFQTDDLFPDPEEPLSREMARRQAFELEYREAQAARVAAMRAEADRIKAAMLGTNASEYAKTPQTAAAALKLGETYRQAVAGIEHAEAEAKLLDAIKRVLPSMDHLDPEDFARKLPDELFKAAGEDAKDTLLSTAKADPHLLDDLSEAARLKVESAKDYADLVRGSIDSLRTSSDTALGQYAASILGMDDEALALTFFGRMAKMLAGTPTPDTVVESLTAMDRWMDRTFHAGKGYMQRDIARTKAEIRGTGMVAARWRARLEKDLKGIASAHGVDDKLDEMAPLAYSMMYKAADPNERFYDWKRFDPRGPGHGDPTALAEMLQRAQKSGLLADERLRADLEKTTAGWVEEIRSMGNAELADDLLNELMSGHIPLVPADDTRLLMLGQHQAFPEAGGAGSSASQAYQKRRTTSHTRFPIPDPALAEKGQWRQFYDFDRWVTDRKDLFGGGRDVAEIARELNVTPAMAQGYQDAYDTITAYDKLVGADPSFVNRFPAKPTDHMELNELWAQGRFRRLVGNSPEPEKLMDGGAPFVMGVRAGAHERSVGMAKIADLVESQARMVKPDLLRQNLRNRGMVGRLNNGMEFRVLTPVRREGGEAFAAEIGGERFRLLDPGSRASWLGKLLPDAVLEGGLLPEKLADRIEDVARMAHPGRGDMETILNSAEHMVGLWKKLTLFRPAWTIVDFIGNLWLAASGGASMGDMTRHATQMFKLRRLIHDPESAAKLAFTLKDGRTVRGDELLNTLLHHGIFERNLSAEVAGKIAKEDASILLKPDTKGIAGKVFEANYKANALSNDWIRGLAFVSFLEQGADGATAARRTLDALFDWHDFSRVEEKVFRRLIPFYSWMRNNWAQQIHLLTQKPIYAASTPLLAHSLEEMMAGNAAVPQENRPQWMREEMVTQLTQNPEDRAGLVVGNLLPVSDLYDILQAGTGTKGLMGLAKKLTTSLNPIPTGIAQLGTGTEFFTGRRIGADAASGDLSAGEFLRNQISPLGEAPRLASAFERSGVEGTGRLLLGGRVQGMDDQRLASTRDREDRETEAKLRGAAARARRTGDAETATTATARLLRLYQARRERGADIPKWAEAELARVGG